jgi:ABC-type Fe3+/spermidine/putrescine transport system ATPase subunit
MARSLTLESKPIQRHAAGDVRIKVTHLNKRYRRAGKAGEVVPIDDISFEVEGQDLVVLLGPSGCGKTTLLRCIAGLERPDSGEIVIDGEVVFSSQKRISLPPNKRPLSMIFQSYALWPHMTVRQNVAYPLTSRRTKGAVVRARVDELLEMIGLTELGEQYPGRISGGQQQRVALARALASDPKVMLFDEPLSNVDALVRQHLRLELIEMQRALGFCGLYVTHDQTEAMEVGKKIAVLDSGRIVDLDTPQRVYQYPVSLTTAKFIGSCNLWTGSVMRRTDDTLFVDTPGLTTLTVRIHGKEDVAAVGDTVTVVSRPENVQIERRHNDDVRGEHNTWPGVIAQQAFSGSRTNYVVGCGDERVQVWSADHTVPTGAHVWISVDPEHLVALRV